MEVAFTSLNLSHGTDFARLPGDCLVLIIKSLRNQEDRKNFFHCCKSTRWSPQILALISRTILNLNRGGLSYLTDFPRGALLRKLFVTGHKGKGDEDLVRLHQASTGSREKEVLAGVQELDLDRTAIEPTKALLALCPNLIHIHSSRRPILFFTECMAIADLPHLQSVHINFLTHKGKTGRHRPMGFHPLHQAMDVIQSKYGSVDWVIKELELIERAPVPPLAAMQGTAIASGVQCIRLEDKAPHSQDLALLTRVFPAAELAFPPSSDEFDSSDYCSDY